MMRNLLLSFKKIGLSLALLVAMLTLSSIVFGQTNTWDGSSSNNWNTASNWSLNLVPSIAHDVVINTTASISVGANTTINSLTIDNSASVTFTSSGGGRTITIDNTGSSIAAGCSLILQGSTGTGTRSMTIAFSGTGQTMSIAGDLILTSVGDGSIYNATNSLTTVTGKITKSSTGATTIGSVTSTASNLSFLSNSTYLHGVNGTPIPTATWDANSNCNITGVTSTIPTVASFNQSFGNFTWNCPGQSATLDFNGNLRNIQGNFEIVSTNNRELRLASGETQTLSVGGNFNISNGILNFNSSTGTFTMNVGGNFTHTGGTITETSTGTGAIVFNGNGIQNYTSGGTVSNTINFTVNSGSTLDLGTSVIDGSNGTFTLSSGAGIITAHTQGLSTTASTGSVQVTGTKSFSATADYTYNGSSPQVTGNALSGASNLTFDNASGVSLSSAVSVSGTLTLNSGKLTSTSTNLLSVTNTSSSAISGGNSTTFISGPVSWTLPASLASGSTYDFPVGEGTTYLPFTLENPTAGTGTLTAQVEAFSADPGGSVDGTLDSKSTTEYWSLATTGNFTNSTISIDRNTAISPFDVIAGSTTLTGTYTSLAGTAGSTGVTSSNSIGSNRYFVLATKKQTITTGAVSSSPFCVSSTNTDAGTVAYTSTGAFSSATFTAKLSDASGSFTSATSIGTATVTGTNPSGSINITIPAGTVSGTGYKIRIDCTSPAVTGTVSSAFEIVNGVNNVSSPSSVSGLLSSTLTWTNPASCYDEIMIVGKESSSISGTPSGNGTGYTASLTFGSGTAFGGGYVVYKGTTSPQTVTNLANGSTYYFKFFTRNGTVWSSGTETSITISNVSQATDYFRSKTTGNWSVTSSWESSPDGVSWINATLTPTSSANTITIQSGHTVSVNSSLSVDQTVIENGGTLGVNNGQTLTLADGSGTDLAVNGSLLVSGTLLSSGTVTTTGTVTFNSGATYEHAQNGGSIPSATWNAASTCLVTGMTTTGPAGLNQTFGNLTWNCAAQTGNIVTAGDITVQGNFVLSNGAFTLSDGPARNMFIAGNYTQTNGIFDFNVGTSGTALTKLYVAGNFLNTASSNGSMSTVGNGRYNGEIIFNGSGTQTLSFSNSNAAQWISYTIEPSSTVQLLSSFQLYGDNSDPQYYANFTVNGTLDAGSFSITDGVPQANSSVVVINSGANFITANPTGISGTFSSATTKKTFSSSANYEFQGVTTGTFVTTPVANTVNNLTVNGSAGVSLSQSISVAGNLIFTSGNLTSTTSNLLSITNTSTSAITGASSSSFINGPMKWTLPPSLGSGSTYNFPTGKGSAYLPFSLVNPTTGTGAVTAQVEAFAVNSGGSFDATLESISTTEYWSLATTGNFTNSSISLDRSIPNDPLDVIAGSTSAAGTYTSLEGTPVATGVSGSDPIDSYRYFVLAEKKKTTIATGSIGTPFCAGSSVSIPFTITGIYTSGNVFTAQLSNASGSFSSPVNIGTLTSVNAGTISGVIPALTSAGTGYRIRVVSNLPVATGSDNGSDLTVNNYPSAAGTITGSSSVVQGQSGVSYSVGAISDATSYAWSYSGTGATISGTTNSVTVNFASNATSGNLTVYGINSCGNGTVSANFSITVNSPSICLYGENTSSAIIFVPCINMASNPETVTSNFTSNQYFLLNVIKGLTYQVYTCNTPSQKLKMAVYEEGNPSGSVIASSTSNTGNTCNADGNNVYLSFTSPISGQVRVLINSIADCSDASISGLTVNVNVSGGSNTEDDPNAAGTDSWIGHIYDGATFNNYLGYYLKTETFQESFGTGGTWPNNSNDDATCFYNINSNNSVRASLKDISFSARYLMNSTKHGLYRADMTGDDGDRLLVDGIQVYSDWSDHSPRTTSNVLFSLSGSSTLAFEYYENGGQNVTGFNNLVQIFANNLSTNTSQSICVGNSGSAISGDVFGALPSGISLSGTGYQWTYSTTTDGVRTAISGATGATFTPNASGPFSTPGTYYIYRNASLSSTNNITPNPYVATNESNAATLIVSSPTFTPTVTIVASTGTTICTGASVTLTATAVNASGGTVNYDFKINGNSQQSTTSNTYSTSSLANGNLITCVITITGGTCLTSSTATSNTITMTVNPLTGVPAFIVGATSVCQNDPDGTYTATAANSTALTYSVLPISAGSINTSTGVMNWSASFSGTATITATATGLCGTTSSDRIVTVNPLPATGEIVGD